MENEWPRGDWLVCNSAPSEQDENNGICAYKSRAIMENYINSIFQNIRVDALGNFLAVNMDYLQQNLSKAFSPPHHGICFGEVELAGTVIEYSDGYRAEMGRPLRFYAAVGEEQERALAALRRNYA
jgi:hypothetical protein